MKFRGLTSFWILLKAIPTVPLVNEKSFNSPKTAPQMCCVLVGVWSSSVLAAKVAYLPMEHHSCKNIAQPQEQKLPRNCAEHPYPLDQGGQKISILLLLRIGG